MITCLKPLSELRKIKLIGAMLLICLCLMMYRNLLSLNFSLSYFNRLRKRSLLQTENDHFSIFILMNSVILIFDTASSNWKHNL